MPLGEISAFYDWEKRRRSFGRDQVWSAVRWWIADLAVTPWQAPSVPFAELSNQPEYEVRSAVVPGSGVEVFYRHDYATDIVDVIWVGPPWI